MPKDFDFVLVNIKTAPRPGPSQVLTRVKPEDRWKVQKASRLLGISYAEFTRMVLVNAANKVIDQSE